MFIYSFFNSEICDFLNLNVKYNLWLLVWQLVSPFINPLNCTLKGWTTYSIVDFTTLVRVTDVGQNKD